MFSFTAHGRIGTLARAKANNAIARVSIAADRRVEGQDGPWTKTEWLACVSFDASLTDRIMNELHVGDSVVLEGRIEPRKRQVGDINVTEHALVIASFALQPKTTKPRRAGTPEVAA